MYVFIAPYLCVWGEFLLEAGRLMSRMNVGARRPNGCDLLGRRRLLVSETACDAILASSVPRTVCRTDFNVPYQECFSVASFGLVAAPVQILVFLQTLRFVRLVRCLVVSTCQNTCITDCPFHQKRMTSKSVVCLPLQVGNSAGSRRAPAV